MKLSETHNLEMPSIPLALQKKQSYGFYYKIKISLSQF